MIEVVQEFSPRRQSPRNRRTRPSGGSRLPGPVDIFGANLRLDYNPIPGNIVLNGSAVAGWVNAGLAVGANPAQANPALQPLYIAIGSNGKPCVRFTRADGELLTVASGGPSQLADHSIFIVATVLVLPGQYTGFFGVGDNTKSTGIGINNLNQSWFGGANLTSPTGAALAATSYQLGKVVSGANTQGYRNGVADGSAAAIAYGAATNVTIGAYDPAGTSVFGCSDCDIYRIIGVDVAATAQQIAALKTYFTFEYAI